LQSFNKAGETENVYNVTPDPSKASLFVISQVGDHRIQVTVTLTSKIMREEEPVAEGMGGEGENAAAPVNQGTTSELIRTMICCLGMTVFHLALQGKKVASKLVLSLSVEWCLIRKSSLCSV
jgi:hypothetical protein